MASAFSRKRARCFVHTECSKYGESSLTRVQCRPSSVCACHSEDQGASVPFFCATLFMRPFNIAPPGGGQIRRAAPQPGARGTIAPPPVAPPPIAPGYPSYIPQNPVQAYAPPAMYFYTNPGGMAQAPCMMPPGINGSAAYVYGAAPDYVYRYAHRPLLPRRGAPLPQRQVSFSSAGLSTKSGLAYPATSGEHVAGRTLHGTLPTGSTETWAPNPCAGWPAESLLAGTDHPSNQPNAQPQPREGMTASHDQSYLPNGQPLPTASGTGHAGISNGAAQDQQHSIAVPTRAAEVGTIDPTDPAATAASLAATFALRVPPDSLPTGAVGRPPPPPAQPAKHLPGHHNGWDAVPLQPGEYGFAKRYMTTLPGMTMASGTDQAMKKGRAVSDGTSADGAHPAVATPNRSQDTGCFCGRPADFATEERFKDVWVTCTQCGHQVHGECARLTRKQVGFALLRRTSNALAAERGLPGAFLPHCMHSPRVLCMPQRLTF